MCVHTDTCTRRQARAHSHTSTQIQAPMCTRTNTRIDRCSRRHRYAHAGTHTYTHTCTPRTGTHRHAHRHVLAHTGSTLSQVSGSGGGTTGLGHRCHLLPPGDTRPAEGAQGPFPPGPVPAGGGACGHHPPSQTRSPLFPGLAWEEATAPGDHLVTESSRPCLVSLVLAQEMSWGGPQGSGMADAEGQCQHRDGRHKEGEPAHCPGHIRQDRAAPRALTGLQPFPPPHFLSKNLLTCCLLGGEP